MRWATMGGMARGRRVARKQMPAWLVGLIVGAVVFAVILFVLEVLGYGDDPAIGMIILPR